MSVAESYAAVRRRIAAACARSSRDVSDVRLVAVTKYAPVEAVRELVALGHRDLGESRPQQLLERAALFDGAGVTWHLIGHLQRNKARKVLSVASLIHSADNVRLLEALDRLAGELSLRPRVLIEVNVSGEASKDGFPPDELRSAWPRVAGLRRLDVAGLMTMAPYSEDPEATRPYFRALRRLRDDLAAAGPLPLPELSMGMSGDFEVAIEEGATIVRVGSSLFEE
ncbi:MAG TPA: YggS family pyridoxal phosphate-dependent enzyme [Planctomycetaceae bacterium]